MGDAARANRTALRHLVDQASALLPDGKPYVPLAVRAVDVGPADADSGAPDWPGPRLENFASGRFLGSGCLVIDESAVDLLRAAVTNSRRLDHAIRPSHHRGHPAATRRGGLHLSSTVVHCDKHTRATRSPPGNVDPVT